MQSERADVEAHSKEGSVSITTPNYKASVDHLIVSVISSI
jgi:hypothetical protein